MSGTTSVVTYSLTPTLDTITVGTAGTFNQDSTIAVSDQINADLALCGTNTPIDVIFNPGTYGEPSNILFQPGVSVSGLASLNGGTSTNAVLKPYSISSSYVSSSVSGAVDTITVGTAGAANADSNVDISTALNAALRAAPLGTSIVVNFNPGSYGVLQPILLPSNTTMVGNGAELNFLPGSSDSALICNAGTWNPDINVYSMNADGTYTQVPYIQKDTERLSTGDASTTPAYANTQINTDISVSGLILNETGSTVIGASSNGSGFGTMFANCTDVNVSNNLYIAGNDANGFINVNKGVAMNNIAIGQIYALDNWNGTSNVVIADNQIWQNANTPADTTSCALQINSCPNGDTNISDPGYGGNDVNDAAIANDIAGNTNTPQSASNVVPLWDVGGATSIKSAVVSGNIDISLAGYTQGFFAQGAVSNVQVTNNVVSGAVIPSEQTGLIDDVYGYDSSTGVTGSVAGGQISGNLIFDASVSSSNATIVDNVGTSSQTSNNALISETTFTTTGNSTKSQIVSGSIGGSASSNVTAPTLWISVPRFDYLASQALANISVIDNASATLTVTASATFGAVSSSAAAGNASVSFSGSLATINQDLTTLHYTPSTVYASFDDAVEITATDNAGYQFTSYIPIFNSSLGGASAAAIVVTIPAGFIAPSASYPTLSSSNGATPPSLGGNMLVATSGTNNLALTTATSIVYLGTGADTVTDSSVAAYITAGIGTSVVSLTGGGNVTFVGGSGSSTITATTGSDLVEGAAGAITINGGAAPLSILGGMGKLTYLDSTGTGNTFLTTLPTDGGNLNIQLGTGQSTILAYSGNDTITSQIQNASVVANVIQLGSGNDCVNANGTDVIYAGIGADTINFNSTQTTTIIGGGNTITLQDSVNSVTLAGSLNTAYVIGGTFKTQLAHGALTLAAGQSTIDTQLYLSVTDIAGHNVLTVGSSSTLNDSAGNDTITVTGNIANDSISGVNGANIINVGTSGYYTGSSTSFVSTKNILNLTGSAAATTFAANQDTINLLGNNTVLILEANNQLPDTAAQTSTLTGSTINVSGASQALVETAGNNIVGANGAILYVSQGNNTIAGSNINAQLGGGPGDQLVLTGSNTVMSSSPYSYQTNNTVPTVQDQMTVQSGQFTMGGLDALDQVAGTAFISLFGGNHVTLGGANDTVAVSDQLYGGNTITNNGAGNIVNLANFSGAATTINANASTLVNSTDNTGKMIGQPNNNSGEGLMFIAASGTSNTIMGAASNAAITLFGGQSSTNIVYGGKMGANSLNGGTGGGDYFKAGGTGDILIGGTKGKNTLIAAGGAETLVGAGLGNDAFSITGGGGTDVIQSFTGALTFNAALSVSSETTISGAMVVTLSDQTKITFSAVSSLKQTGNVFTLN